MRLYPLFLLIFILICTESIGQEAIDSVLFSFNKDLEKKGSSPETTFKKFGEEYASLLSDCLFRIKFYKAYSNYHYNVTQRDDLVLSLQKDSILPLQQKCLASTEDELTTTLLNIGRSYHYLTLYAGEDLLEEAEEYFLKVSSRQAVSDTITKRYARRYRDIAIFYDYKKDYKKAELFYENALNVFIGEKASPVYLGILSGKSRCLMENKRYEAAISLLSRATKIAESNPSLRSNRTLSVELSRYYDNLALSYQNLKRYNEAKKYILKARKIVENPKTGHLRNAIIYASRHAHILKFLQQYNQAYHVCLDAKELIKDLGEEVTLKQISANKEDIADVFSAKGDYDKAIDLYHESISDIVSVYPTDKFKNPTLKGNEIFDLQYLHRQLGLKSKALLEYGKKTNKVEAFQGALDAILKYDSLGHELLKEDWEEDSHLLRVKELSLYYEVGICSALELYKRSKDEHYLNAAHQISSSYKNQLLHRGILIKDKKKKVLSDSLLSIEKTFLSNINDLETDYLVDLAADIETKESLKNYLDQKTKLDKFYLENKVSDLIDKSISASSKSQVDLRSQLDEKTAALEYFVAEDSIYVFLLTKKHLSHQVLKYSDSELDAYLNYLISDTIQKNTTYNLSSLVELLSDVNPDEISNLIVIPDQKLLQLPFETLMLNGKYLLEQFDLSYQYSKSILTDKKSASKYNNYLGFASNYNWTDSLQEAKFARLPFAIEEVETAKKQFGNAIYLNAEASKSNFKKHCETAGVIHLALHSKLNNEFPDQSSLVFQSDSTYEYLTASEIYNLDLNNELTVLSACNTAVGQINAGDGVRSITRSFIHAGSAAVITTLWEAPDISTSRIINSFYQNLHSGSPKNVALKDAKLEYLNSVQPSYRHPKYWAHIVLVGNTSPIKSSSILSNPILALITLSILILLLVFMRKK